MSKTLRTSSKLENFPADLISAICLFFETPDVIESLLAINKHFHFTICSNLFFGTENVIFPVGLNFSRLLDRITFQDDPLMSKLFGRVTSDTNSDPLSFLKNRKKRYGITDMRLEDGEVKPMNYVRNIRVVEAGVYYDNEMMKIIFDLFPRLTGLEIQGMLQIRDNLFTEYIFGTKGFHIRKIDICGCDELTEDIFFSTNFLRDHLEELHLGGEILKKLVKKKKCLTFNRLKKVVFKAPFTGCTSWNRPTIPTLEFHNILHPSETIEEIQFLHVSFEGVKKEVEDRPYFLDHFKSLKKLKLLNPVNIQLSVVRNITQLEVADFCFETLSDDYFDNFPNLRKLRLRGGVRSLLTKNIFLKIPRLTHLDLMYFNGIYLYKPNKNKKLSDDDITFFRSLKSLKICCNRTNIAEELKLLGEDSEDVSKVLFPCLCSDFIIQKNLGDQQNEKDTTRYVHYMCEKCDVQTKGCGQCGKKGMDIICKLDFNECFACKKISCCLDSCEKCARSFCKCTKITLQMPFCGEMCGYEKLCEDCVAMLSRCEKCRSTVCQVCSSKCIQCNRLLCEENCIDHHEMFDEDDEDYDEDGKYIPRDERICKKCKENN